MEALFNSQQGEDYISEQSLNYPVWQCGPWISHIESHSPTFLDVFDSNTLQSPFDDSFNWMNRNEPVYSTNPVSPTAISPTVEEPPVHLPSTSQTRVKKSSSSNGKRKRQAKIKKEPSEKINPGRIRTYHSKSVSSSGRSPTEDIIASNGTNEDFYHERNRIASTKFRERKRNEIAQLESEEYSIEDVNRQLRRVLESLTSEILSLKMQILEHTDCNCKLIQAYINKEAVNFVQSLQDDDSEAPA
ncbi:hypothetical protein QQS21_009069 [Conoideocrella luteorostrata]|uniref:BZIP domain-containing protein n=1 Tax=Conoideocrella luteorostrata TaxID=1105319 RepID=A0AAJ0CHT4_9HYPO|nr:hypothetical protein QQS21_009069 [Conoideocrella luteorostrata]